MITTEPRPARSLRKAYYRSFLSYRVPFEPEHEISFAETEGMGSYYIAHYDSEERLREFEKILLTRLEKRAIHASGEIRARWRPYFSVNESAPGRVEVGRELAYTDTERSPEFFQGEEGELGTPGEVWLMRKVPVLRDRYSYWPSGVLRERALTRMDQSESVWHYDEEGKSTVTDESVDSNVEVGAQPITAVQ